MKNCGEQAIKKQEMGDSGLNCPDAKPPKDCADEDGPVQKNTDGSKFSLPNGEGASIEKLIGAQPKVASFFREQGENVEA